MDSSYFKEKQTIGMCDKNGKILGPIEKWEAHRKGILHRAFTVAIIFQNKLLVQHRKHPAFNGVFDTTISSHQLMVNGQLENTEKSVLRTLKREWNIEEKDLAKPLKNKGFVYYKARDKYSEYTEHEVCDIVIAQIKVLKEVNLDFAYGYSLVAKQELYNKDSRIYQNLAPWVKVMIEKNLL